MAPHCMQVCITVSFLRCGRYRGRASGRLDCISSMANRKTRVSSELWIVANCARADRLHQSGDRKNEATIRGRTRKDLTREKYSAGCARAMDAMRELEFATIEELSTLLAKRKVSPVELTRLYLSRIERLNPKLNAFITVAAESALAEAALAERELLRRRPRGPLHGIPVALKDNIATRNLRTTMGSVILRGFVPIRRRHGGQQTTPRRRNCAWQDEPARIRLRGDFGEPALRRGAKSLGHGQDCRWFERRLSGGRRGRAVCRGNRERHGRLHSHSLGAVRRGGSQAHIWTRQRPRSLSAGAEFRPRRPDCAERHGRSAGAGMHRRARSARPDDA